MAQNDDWWKADAPVQRSADGDWWSADKPADAPKDGPLARGFNRAKQSMAITGNLATGDAAGAARNIREAAEYSQANPGMAEGRELSQAWQRGDGVMGGISEVVGEIKKDWNDAPGLIGKIGATGRNLRAMGEGIVEQVPNMIAPTIGMVGGGAAGSAAAGLPGMIGGAWLGASAGNTLVEGGGMAQEALQKAGIDPRDTAAVEQYLKANGNQILGQSATKGAIIGAVDTLTAGLAGKVLNAPARAAATRALADLGVDTTNKAAVKAAMETPQFATKIAQDAAYKASTTGAGNLARNVGAAALDPAGEFAGEFVGQGVATGEWDTKNAALEALSSIGQSGVMFAGQKGYQALTRPNSKAQPQPITGTGAPSTDSPIVGTSTVEVDGKVSTKVNRQDGSVDIDGVQVTPPTASVESDSTSPADDVIDVEPITPVKPSEAMGIDRAAGPLSRAAADAVDSGASPAVTPTVMANPLVQAAQAPAPTPPVVDTASLKDRTTEELRGFLRNAQDTNIRKAISSELARRKREEMAAMPDPLQQSLIDQPKAEQPRAAEAPQAVQSQPQAPQEQPRPLRGVIQAEPRETGIQGAANGLSDTGVPAVTGAGAVDTQRPSGVSDAGRVLRRPGKRAVAPADAELAQGGADRAGDGRPGTGDGTAALNGRPARWRQNALQAKKVARELGLNPDGKRLAEIVAEVDAFDARSNVQDTPQGTERVQAQAQADQAPEAARGDGAETGRVPDTRAGDGVRADGVEGITRTILESIADQAKKTNRKYYDKQIAKGLMTRDEADRRIANDDKMWAEQKVNDRTERIAKAIAEKDPTVLVGAWAKEGQGTYGNEGSMEAFRKLTGINLARMNSADRAKAIFDWAGWSEDQVRADVEKRRAERNEQIAKAEEKRKQDDAAGIERLAASTKLTIEGQDGETTVKAYIDGLIEQGYTEVGQTKVGAIKRTLLFRPGANSGYPMRGGILADYAKVASERFKAQQPPAQEAKPAEKKAQEPKAEDLPEGWTATTNGFTGRPVYRFTQDIGQPFAVVTKTDFGYEVQIRQGDKLVSSVNMNGAAKFEALDKATQMLGEAGMATHKDPGEKAEPATKAVVTDAMKTAAKNEETKPSEMRKWLLGEIDKALLNAPDRADYDEAVKRMGEKDAVSMFTGNGFLGKNAETGFVTFDVPGDGKFKVRNSVRGLLEFRKNVSASLGFKDSGQKTVKPEQNEGVRSGSGGQMAAITNMIEEGDFEAARDYAEAVGIKLEDVKVPRGERKPQWDQFLKDGTVPSPPDTRPLPPQRTPAQIAEDERLAKEAEAKKPKDTGWNMAGTGYGGKRYRGRNITTADGREIVARIYENAGNYDEVEVKVDGVRKFTVRDSYNAQDKADAFIKTLIEGEQEADDTAAQQDAPAGRTYLAVPFKDKDYAKRAGAKWDDDKKLWYTDPVGGDGLASGEININLQQFIPNDYTTDDRFNYYSDKAVAEAVALNASARDGVQYEVKKRKHPDGIMLWSAVKPGEQSQSDSTTIPEGYKPAGEPFYRGGKQIQGYAPFNIGERVTMKDSAGQSGVIESLTSPDDAGVFSGALVKFDNGMEQIVSFGKLQAASAPVADAKPMSSEQRRVLNESLLAGTISVEDYMKATGLTDDDVGTFGDGLRRQAEQKAQQESQYYQLINKMHEALTEQMKSAMDAPSSTPPQRKAKQERMARIDRDRSTLDMLARKFEHPFNNNYVSKLSPALKSRFARRFEGVKTGEFAKRDFSEASYKAWAELLIHAANKKNPQATPQQQEAAEPFEHAGLKIRQSRVRVADEVETRWIVQSPENAEREARGERQISGDRIVESREAAIRVAEQEVKRYADEKASKAEFDRAEQEEKAKVEARKEVNRGKTLAERRADAILDKPTTLPPSLALGAGTKREAMQRAVEEGRLIREVMVRDTAAKKRDEDAISRVRASGYILGLSNENIPVVKAGLEAQARLKENKYEKPEYRVYAGRSENDFFREISKTEYDYAQSLKRAAEQPQQADKQGEKKPAEKIEDFGEKLPPSRRAMAAKLSEAISDEDIAVQPLSKIWPVEENEAIEDTFAAAVAHVMREAIPAKPRKGYKLNSWVGKVKVLRDFAAKILRGTVSRETFLAEMDKLSSLRDMRSKIKLLEQIDRAQWKRIGEVSEAPGAITYVDGKAVPQPSASVTVDGKSHWLRNSGDINDHVDTIKTMLEGDAPESKLKFEVFRATTGDRKVFISKKGDKEYRRLMEFDTPEQARKALKDQYAELVAAWEGIKGRDNITERDLRTSDNRPRSGKDWRKGKDVSAEEFQAQFGFRGGEFGKWVSQGKGAQERQFMLNNAYDALMDLSEILGVPPKAISLDGSLGIAFGSRGGGWASAHFEPSNLVINLTKPRGAGALAHEWFHALDNYFARKRNGGEVPIRAGVDAQNEYRRNNYITHKTRPMMVRKDGRGSPVTRERLAEWRKSSPDSAYLAADQWIEDPNHKQGVRAEVEERFDELVKALDASPMLQRARTLDGVKSGDGYWSRTLERAARSFENYVQTRMMEQGYHNDFLANVKAAPDVGKNVNRYPYLLPSEVAPIADAFGNLFQTIQTRETDDGNVEMYYGTKENSRQGTPVDRAVMDMAGEGRDANDILSFIANTSKSPYRRNLARKLLATGANPAVSLGGEMGGGAGFRFLAKYSRKNHEVTLSEAAGDRAEQIFLHETVHAATLLALDKGGLQAQQMIRLYESAKKQGLAEGQYGMKNVGEFVAEAFTNPEFQKILKSMKAPEGNLWKRFVALVRRILGMSDGSQDMLTAALEVGAKVMRENMPLRAARSFRAEDGPAFMGVNQTETPAFRRWFGDSKVVDADGKPLVVYHGTDREFSAFDPASSGKNFVAGSGAFFFTPDIAFAEQIADWATENSEEASGVPTVMPVYLSLQNPLVQDFTKRRSVNIEKLIREAKAGGHDGVIAINAKDKMPAWRLTQYIAFRPEQIKSAIGNNGNFDPEDADIAHFGIADASPNNAREAVKQFDLKQMPRNTWGHYRGMLMQALGRRQIVDLYSEELPQLVEYDRLVQQMDAEKNDTGAEADKLATEWGKLDRVTKKEGEERRLAELMHDATLAQIDPEKEFVAGDNRLKYGELKARFDNLTPEAQAIYRQTRDMYSDHYNKVREAIKDRIERSELSASRKKEMMAKMDDDFFKKVKGVYFPLARFGSYVMVTKDAAGDVVNVTRAETLNEAQEVRRQIMSAFPKEQGYTTTKVMKDAEFNPGRDAVGKGFMADLFETLDKQGVDEALRDSVSQLYLSSLPDLSWAKHGIHRKGTPGFSQDARRAFAQNMFHGARYLAKLRYADQMQTQLDEMQDHIKAYSGVDEYDGVQAQQVVDEMVKRHEFMMNPKVSPVSTALTSIGFVFHLGLSPASAMVNLSQTALVAYPIMGAKWGFTRASTALLKASREVVQAKNDLSKALKGDELDAFNKAVKDGTIDVTMAHDLAGISQGEDQKVVWAMRPVMRAASFMFHHAERFNRQATFMAAYRLSKESGKSPEVAYEEAKKATYDGHFDYAASNRPRLMQGNWQKVIFLFKQYAQSMIYTLSRNAYLSVKGLDPAQRSEARKALAGILSAHAAAAGVLGLPLVGPLLAAASFIGGDDDEPWDAEVAMQNMMAEAFGPKAAEVIARGLSRLTPFDLSGRVALNKLILPDVYEGLEGQQWAESFLAGAAGPVAGIFTGMIKGLQKITDGDYQRGFEDMMPAALRGPLKALRYGSEGAVDKSGVVILDEVGPAGVASQALGFSPSNVRRSTERKGAIMDYDRALADRRSTLMRQWSEARMTGDEDGVRDVMEEIRAFNQKNPRRAITPPNLLQSYRARMKRINEADEGVYLPKNRRDAMEQIRF